MNFYLLFIIILILIGIKIHPIKFNADYLEKENTDCIKGIFILIVFYSHIRTYMPYNPVNDNLMLYVVKKLGQLMVTLFLFYSGYGIFESIKKKGESYIKSIPKNRILKTLFNFDIVVLSYAIINYIMGYGNGVLTILGALTGWLSIGNSNWYIFAILVLYFTTYLSCLIFKDKEEGKKVIIINTIFTVLVMIAIAGFRGKGFNYCYNTLMCYPLGMIYSYYKDTINKKIFENKIYYLLLVSMIILFLGIRKFDSINTIYYSLTSIAFVIIVIMLTMKIRIHNKILKWFGENLFYVYILQRIPMAVLCRLGYASEHAYRFAFVCFGLTIILSFIYSKALKKLNVLMFNK